MPRTQDLARVQFTPETVAHYYKEGSRPRPPSDTELPVEALDILPRVARDAVRKALARGGNVAFLSQSSEGQLVIEVRNRRRRRRAS